MKLNCSFVIVFLTTVSATLLGHPSQDEVISESLSYIEKIVTQAPEIIKQHSDEKFYLKEERVFSTDDGEYLLLSDHHNIPIHNSLVFSDNDGHYLSLSGQVLTEKLFKNVCYDCRKEWPGGFALRCPFCFSTNIGNKPNW